MWLCMSVNVTLFDSDSDCDFLWQCECDFIWQCQWMWLCVTVTLTVTLYDSVNVTSYGIAGECDFVWQCQWLRLHTTVPVNVTAYDSASEYDYVTVWVTVLEKRTNFFPMAVFRCRSTKENTSHLMLSQRNWTLKWCTIQWCLRSVQWCMAQCCLRSGQWCMIPCCLKLVQ